MNELPKNPNVRQPYSDVSGDLERIIGDVVEFAGPGLTNADRHNLKVKLAQLDQAVLRARAVLDPISLSDEDWKQALVSPNDAQFGDDSAFQIRGETRFGSDVLSGGTSKKSWWKFW
jgi:hypothetical protein